jgi:4-carboxymuconolactone decarboxylase
MKTFVLLLLLLAPALVPPVGAQTTRARDVGRSGQGQEVTLSGTLRGDRIAIGGETTGWVLEYRDDSGQHSIEVFLPAELKARARNGAMVRVTGIYASQEYVERGPTTILRVSRLEDAAAAAGTPGSTPATAPGARGAASAPATSRLPELPSERMTPSQHALADDVLKVSSVGLGGPYNAMLRSPVMGDRMFKMLDYLRFNTSLPHRLNEFAILIQARLWTSQVEWLAHYPLAIKEGLSEATAADLKAGRRPASMKEDEGAVYDFCMELSTKHAVSETTYARLARVLSLQQIVDLVTVSGTYTTLAMMMNTIDQGVPPGATPPLPVLGLPASSPAR